MSLLFAALNQAAQEHRAAVAAQHGVSFVPRAAVMPERHSWVNLGLVLLTGMVGGAALVAVLLLQQPAFPGRDLNPNFAPREVLYLPPVPAATAPAAVAHEADESGGEATDAPDIRYGIALAAPTAAPAAAEATPPPAIETITKQQVQDNLPGPVVAAIASQIAPYVRAPEPVKAAEKPRAEISVGAQANAKTTRGTSDAAAAMARGDYQAALMAYQTVLDAQPDNKDAQVGKAMALQQSGAAAVALAQWRLLAGQYPDDATIATSYAAALAGIDAAAARLLLQKVLTAQPDFAPALAAVAALDVKAGNMDAAQSAQEQAWALEKQNPAHRLNLAIIADKRGDKAQALALYKQAQAAYADGGWKATLPMSWSAVQARIDYLSRLAQ